MSNTWPKIIRDPVHDIISFENSKCDRLLLDLINTREFQRLRRIKQLGLSQLVFPGADHSRFAHSIGVMHIARRFLRRVKLICPGRVDDDQATAVLAAALLHDVGHGPFSHAFEKITGDKHEQRTLEIIEDSSTEVHRTLSRHDTELPTRLAVFFDEDLEEGQRAGADIPAFLTQIVSSQLDADRFDYLLRDSYSTGTNCGSFDLEWLLHHLSVDDKKGRFVLDHKSLFAAEAYVFARYHMYRTVYYHKTTRAAEVMLRLLFQRFKDLLNAEPNEEAQKKIVPHATPWVVRAFAGKIPLREYLLLDDHSLTEFAKACTSSSDAILADLADGLLHRRLFKAIDVTPALATNTVAFYDKAKSIIVDAKLDPAYSFKDDTPGDTAYKLYDPDADKPATQIYLEQANGTHQEISRCSPSVLQLTTEYKLVRYYFPDSVRTQIESEAKPLLFKE